jgi:hypothetical protein
MRLKRNPIVPRITLSGGAQATSSTSGAGHGGTVQVAARGRERDRRGQRDHRLGKISGERQCRVGDGRLNDVGDPSIQITASAVGPPSGRAAR